MGLNLIDEVTESQLREDIPNFRSGDTVNVDVLIREGGKTRTQAFEGVVIQRSGKGIAESFTVRKMSSGIGVERTFPIHSPIIDTVKIIRRGKVRRSKLFYIRKRSGRSARITERR